MARNRFLHLNEKNYNFIYIERCLYIKMTASKPKDGKESHNCGRKLTVFRAPLGRLLHVSVNWATSSLLLKTTPAETDPDPFPSLLPWPLRHPLLLHTSLQGRRTVPGNQSQEDWKDWSTWEASCLFLPPIWSLVTKQWIIQHATL